MTADHEFVPDTCAICGADFVNHQKFRPYTEGGKFWGHRTLGEVIDEVLKAREALE